MVIEALQTIDPCALQAEVFHCTFVLSRVLKLDDDVYLNPMRLLAASRQWDSMHAQYVGCMKHGLPFKQPHHRWYEPAHLLVGYTYWLHAYGSIYAIAGPVARCALVTNNRLITMITLLVFSY